MFNLTSRNNFSLFVMNLEGQLFHANFEHLTGVMMKMTQGQLLGYREVCTVLGGPAGLKMCMFTVCSQRSFRPHGQPWSLAHDQRTMFHVWTLACDDTCQNSLLFEGPSKHCIEHKGKMFAMVSVHSTYILCGEVFAQSSVEFIFCVLHKEDIIN